MIYRIKRANGGWAIFTSYSGKTRPISFNKKPCLEKKLKVWKLGVRLYGVENNRIFFTYNYYANWKPGDKIVRHGGSAAVTDRWTICR